MNKHLTRAQELSKTVQVALEVRELFENAEVQQWLSTERGRLLMQIENTATIEGDQCRMYAIELKILNALAARMSGLIMVGDLAAEKLAKMDG